MNRFRKALVGATIAGASISAGALAVIGVANAQTDTTVTDSGAAPSTTAPATSTPAAPAPDGNRPAGPAHDPSKGGHTANGITETILTGDQATQVTSVAQKAVPDGTIERVETDAEGAAFEAHMVKADGTHVTVKVNADYSVASIENGMA